MLTRSLPRALFAALLTVVLTALGVTGAPAASAAPACGGAAQSGLTIRPTHDASFYIDPSDQLDAAYVGYSVDNGGSARRDLWVTAGSFTGGSVQLADAADDRRQIPALGAGASATTFFFVDATAETTTAQTHTVTVWDRRPDLDGAAVLASCDFTFSAVVGAQGANANKVTAVSSTPATPGIGGAVTVTVDGQTGQANGAVWVSPAARSSWPTGALRLERTRIQVDLTGDGSWDQDFTDVLYVPTAVASGYTAATKYRATYTFRVTAATSANPTIMPVAQISSGGQFKHTGAYPTLPAVSLTGATPAITVATSVTAADLAVLPTTTSPNGVSGTITYAEVPYRIRATTGSAATVDELVDVPAAGALFKAGSATVTDATQSSAALGDPATSSADPASRTGALHFTGPFSATAGTPIDIEFVMYVPVTAGSYTNESLATLGGTEIGATPSAFPTVTVVTDGDQVVSWSATPGGGSGGSAPVAQTIAFARPADVPVATGSVALSATASSGLPVVFSSSTPAVCTVSGSTLTLLSGGTCTVDADQPGDAGTDAAPTVTRSFTVTRTAQTVTFAQPVDVPLSAGSASLSAYATSGLPVAASSSTPSVCSTSGTTVTLLGPGACTVSVSQDGNGTWAPATPVTRTFTVTRSPQTITFAQPVDLDVAGGPAALTATASSGLPVSFASSTRAVCTVSGADVIPVAVGTCTVTAEQPGSASVAPAAAVARSVAVTASAPPARTPQSVSFTSPADVDWSVGSVRLSAAANSGLPVAFTSLTPAVCTVSGTTAVLVRPGTCTVAADQPGNATYAPADRVTRSFAVRSVVGAPRDVLATAERAQVRVSWAAPAGGIRVDRYVVTLQPGGRTCETTTLSCLFGASPGIDYTATVTAVGVDGDRGPTVADDAPAVTEPVVPGSVPDTDLTLTTDKGLIDRVETGERLVIIGTGFLPYSTATIVVYSEPRVLGTVVTDANGDFRKPVTVPIDLAAGEHDVVASGVAPDGSSRFLRMGVTVSAAGPAGPRAALASTGAQVGLPVMFGVGTLAAGGLLLHLARRRRA